ncbi:uncharacterized protein [Primulina huaijiensis]|uniref:uncharacterized protein n=1 Tax=Primulina huaijiensis TaxID=1492673 RepID=UPI003CC77552
MEGAAHRVDLATLTWGQFKDIFYNKYFPADVRGRLTREFMSLRQGDIFVAEFIRRFDRGCHFVPLIARDDPEKLRHFMDGGKALRDIDAEMNRKRHQAHQSSQPQKEAVHRATKASGVAEAPRCSHISIARFQSYTFIYIRVICQETSNHTRGYGIGIQIFDYVRSSEVYLADSEEIRASVTEKYGASIFDYATVVGVQYYSGQTRAGAAHHFLHLCEEAHEERLPHILASSVTVTEPIIQRLEDVKMARDFPNVFLDEVLGIPPDKEVDFSIELMPVTVLISKTPYRLALAKMKELKDQIQDFLDKGFVVGTAYTEMPPRRVLRSGIDAGREEEIPLTPPNQDARARVLVGMVQLLEQHVGNAARVRPEAAYERFRRMNPEDFHSTRSIRG